MRRRAFTLIELLVVIAIIAILAAILFPVFAQARDKARQAACLSNMKQIGNGLMMYTQDFDEILPTAGHGGANPNRWHAMILPYIKNGGNAAASRGISGVFVCPSRRSYPMSATDALGYGNNANIMGWGDTTNPNQATPSKSLAQIPNSAGTFVIVEGSKLPNATLTGPDNLNPDRWFTLEETRTDFQVNAPGNFANNNATNYTAAADGSCNQCRRPIPRHNGGMNVAYVDGHAKWEKWQNFLGISPTNPKGWAYGDPRNSWDDQ
jgi:prepilin-type N-terminal cleavage/methylation domain-containing protein/prepilin-type processing-associated H-X9-DG protein